MELLAIIRSIFFTTKKICRGFIVIMEKLIEPGIKNFLDKTMRNIG